MTADGKFVRLRDDYVALLEQRIPTLKTVEAHPGRFDEAAIKRISGKAPAVYVAFLGTERSDAAVDGRVEPTANYGAFIVTAGRTVDRDRAGLNLSEVVQAIVRACPEETSVGGLANGFEVSNLWSSAADHGLCLFGVSWQVSMAVGDDDQFLFDPLDPDTQMFLGDEYEGPEPMDPFDEERVEQPEGT